MKPKPDYDQAFKVIADSDPDGFLWPILQRQVQWLRSRSPELPARRRQADLVWEVTRPNGQRGIIHIELQVKAEQTGQEDIRERMADYALRIWKRDHLPARSVVIFLKPVATVPASPFGWDWDDDEACLRYSFDVIRLWELPPERVLATDHYALWPLAGAMGKVSSASVEAIADQIMQAPVTRQQHGTLEALLLEVAGLRLQKRDIASILRRNPMLEDLLKESSFTEIVVDWVRPRIQAETRSETIREVVQVAIEGRFGTVPPEVLTALNTADEATLKAIVAHISTDSLEDVRARLGLAAEGHA